ncbi:MAG: hypothetical protein WBM90_02940 [Acidimicrobiia bacterium]
MSTTVVHPEITSGKGPSGRLIGMVVAGLVVAAGVGFAISNQGAADNAANATQTESAVVNPELRFVEQYNATQTESAIVNPELRYAEGFQELNTAPQVIERNREAFIERIWEMNTTDADVRRAPAGTGLADKLKELNDAPAGAQSQPSSGLHLEPGTGGPQ